MDRSTPGDCTADRSESRMAGLNYLTDRSLDEPRAPRDNRRKYLLVVGWPGDDTYSLYIQSGSISW